MIIQATLDAQGTLAHGGQRESVGNAVADAILETQAPEPGAGQNDGIVFAGIQLGQAGVDVTAQYPDLKVRGVGPGLGLAGQAGGTPHPPLGKLVDVLYWLLTKASVGSSRSQIATSPRPSGNAMGTSFMECTARSARPSSMASSSSFTNRPLPPIFASGTSRILSPWVLILTSSTVMLSCSRSSSDLMNSACHSARALLRVAMRRVRLDMALTVVRGKCAPRLPCGSKKVPPPGCLYPSYARYLPFIYPVRGRAGVPATTGERGWHACD